MLFFSGFLKSPQNGTVEELIQRSNYWTCKFRLVTFIRASSTNVIIQSVCQEKHYTVRETKYLKFTSTRKIIESNPYHVLLQEKKRYCIHPVFKTMFCSYPDCVC